MLPLAVALVSDLGASSSLPWRLFSEHDHLFSLEAVLHRDQHDSVVFHSLLESLDDVLLGVVVDLLMDLEIHWAVQELFFRRQSVGARSLKKVIFNVKLEKFKRTFHKINPLSINFPEKCENSNPLNTQ